MRFAACLTPSVLVLVLVLCAPSFAEPIPIGGQVVADGQPVAGARDGRVEITTVPDGSWEMLIAAGDSATLSLRVSAPGDAGRIQLSPGGGVSVEVPELADGRVGVGLTLTGPDGRLHRGVAYGGGGVATYALRAGRVSVSNLAPGPWTLTVKSGERSWSESVVVTPGAPVEVTLQ